MGQVPGVGDDRNNEVNLAINMTVAAINPPRHFPRTHLGTRRIAHSGSTWHGPSSELVSNGSSNRRSTGRGLGWHRSQRRPTARPHRRTRAAVAAQRERHPDRAGRRPASASAAGTAVRTGLVLPGRSRSSGVATPARSYERSRVATRGGPPPESNEPSSRLLCRSGCGSRPPSCASWRHISKLDGQRNCPNSKQHRGSSGGGTARPGNSRARVTECPDLPGLTLHACAAPAARPGCRGWGARSR
jgi:hypothetical protein